MLKYKLESYGSIKTRIKPIEIERETKYFVILKNGNRQAKHDIYDTFDAAKATLCRQLERALGYANDNVKNYTDELKVAKSLTL